MNRGMLLLTVALGAFTILTQQSVEELMRAVITVYLLIAGFAVLFLQREAREFLRPLVGIGIALLLLPPLFRDLVACAERTLKNTLPSNVTIGSEWLMVPVSAIIVFAVFRVVRWYRARPCNTRREIYRERERVAPQFDLDDDPRD